MNYMKEPTHIFMERRGKGVHFGQARAFALAPLIKNNFSSRAGEEIKRWGVVVSLTSSNYHSVLHIVAIS